MNLTPLRNIHLSGGLFTENLLLKIRDKRDQFPEVQWITFGEKWQEEKKRYYEVWDWAKRLFGEITDKLDSWTVEERFEKWVKPLLQKLGHESESKPSIDLASLSEEEQDNILNRIQVTHQLKDHAKIGLHICDDDNFDERNETNYQKKSQHDHFQRFILLNEGIRWGLLSNGKYIRLLGEYSNIYAKGYVQFNLDSIFINKDESEFWVLYALIQYSRFNETYGLNPADWIDKLKKKWRNLTKKLSSEDVDINSNIISEDVLKIYNKNLNQFIDKANNEGVMAIKSSDSEIFMQNLKESGRDLNEIGRDFYLKELDSVILNINKNISIIHRLQKRSQEEGIEAGKKLRENVKKALELMGEGLINSSRAFTDDILKGNIEIKDFYQELLRITYRIIFIFYAESKDLLPGVATIYYNDLGLTFLRKKAQHPIRDDQNTDLWYRVLLLFKYLDIGEISLGINAFSGELFNPERIPLILDESYKLFLSNSVLLKVIRELTIVDLGIGLQPIDYSEVGEEEIGSIYEALLDFHPRYTKHELKTYHFKLEEIHTERKTTGTYYTPKVLIDIFLKTALKPVVENRLDGLSTKKEKLDAILDLKICDPACGGGSFLLATIDYLGKIYAQIESGEEIPNEDILRESRRKVLQHCIYGVDLNPMALELAKISLWLKVAVKEKPLTFIDNHLKVGNSLIGFVKKEKIEKIPSNSFNAIKGKKETGIPSENEIYVKAAKRGLKNLERIDEKNGISYQTTLFPYQDSEDFAEVAIEIFKMEENNLKDLEEKKNCYVKLKKTNSWRNLNLQCNLWTSAFFWDMGESHINDTPTDTLIYNAKKGSINQNNPVINEVDRLIKKYHFFNWYLEFPEVFRRKNSGFDCILMNPPWEIINLKEMEFFDGKSELVLNTSNQTERQKEIKKLLRTNPDLHKDYVKEYRKIKKEIMYIKNSKIYNYSIKGYINSYAVFLERVRSLLNNKHEAKIGCIVKSALLYSKDLAKLFRTLIEKNELDILVDFINENQIFPIHSSLKFCLLVLSNSKSNKETFHVLFNQKNPMEIQKHIENFAFVKENNVFLEFKKTDFELFNPNSKNTPFFSSKLDFTLIHKAYSRAPILINKNENKNFWGIFIKRFFVSSDDSSLFKTAEDLNKKANKDIKFLPVYSGASIWLYDHRYNEIKLKSDKSKKRKADQIRVSDQKHKDPYYSHIPIYWIQEELANSKFPEEWQHSWFFAYRRISGSTNERTFIITVIPKVPSIESLQNIYFESFKKEIICLLANMATIPFDYIVRNKLSSTAISQYTVEQLPVFPPAIYNKSLYKQILRRVLKLTYVSWDLNEFYKDFSNGRDNSPYPWDSGKRERIMAELDAIFALIYGYNKNEISYILNTFAVLKKKELKKFGEFKTKNLILEAYEKFNSDPELGPLFRLEGVDLEKIKGE